jgi:APA family basic amino acid/polyamine antiporter
VKNLLSKDTAIEEKLFARKSSGLIKEANTSQATFFNIANIMGSKFAWSVAYLGLFPVALIMGTPPYILGILLFGFASYILAIIYVQITTTMPRSGADYVIPARIMGPFWGWINSWMIVWSWTPVWSWMAWVTVRNIKQLVDILRIAGITTANIPWLLDSPSSIYLGCAVIIIGMLAVMMPPRKYYRLIAVLGIFSIFSLVLIAIGTAGVSPTTFAANMKTLLGTSPSELVNTAIKNGYDPKSGYDMVSAAGLAGYILFVIGGFQYSASISGEMRGDVKKSLTISILGSLTFFMIFSVGLIWFMLNQFGYDFTVGWSFLFWNARSAAPLSLPPINALLLTVALPSLYPLWIIAGVAAIIGAWLVIPASMLYINRLCLAWGIDRMIPKSVSEVHPKYRQPMKLVLIEGILGVAFYLVLILAPDFNPVNYAWWNTLMFMPSYIFPAICALLLPRRRPDLTKAVPWRKWLAPLAILWLIIIVPFYIFAGVIGSVPPLTPGLSFAEYAISTGLIATIVTVIIGIGIYYLIRWHNLKQGIDFKQIFQTIPPE